MFYTLLFNKSHFSVQRKEHNLPKQSLSGGDLFEINQLDDVSYTFKDASVSICSTDPSKVTPFQIYTWFWGLL